MMTFLYSNINQDNKYSLQCYEINIILHSKKKIKTKNWHIYFIFFKIKMSYAVPATNRDDILPSHWKQIKNPNHFHLFFKIHDKRIVYFLSNKSLQTVLCFNYYEPGNKRPPRCYFKHIQRNHFAIK